MIKLPDNAQKFYELTGRYVDYLGHLCCRDCLKTFECRCRYKECPCVVCDQGKALPHAPER